jgi:hypothetical protein
MFALTSIQGLTNLPKWTQTETHEETNMIHINIETPNKNRMISMGDRQRIVAISTLVSYRESQYIHRPIRTFICNSKKGFCGLREELVK